MGKSIDKVGLSLIGLLLGFLLFYRLTGSVVTSALASLLLVASFILFAVRPGRRKPKDKLSKKNFIRYILLRGNGALKTILENALPAQYQHSDIGEHTLLQSEKERILIYYAYKFGSLSEEDVAKSYRLAEKEGCERIYALTNHLDRKALAITEYIPQRFTVINAATLYKYLEKRGLIPKKEALPKKKGKAIKFLQAAFNREHTKYYVWAGLSTALLALFTPITTYYIVFSFINLALAMATIFLGERSAGEDHLFRD